MMSALLNWLKLVYEPFGQNTTLDFGLDQPWRNQIYLRYKIKLKPYCPNIYTVAIGYRLYGRLTIHDEKSSSVLMDEIKIGDRKQSVDDRTSEFLLQEIKEKLQSLDEILRPKETRISIPQSIATFPEWNRKLM